jgi:hypothetical protein
LANVGNDPGIRVMAMAMLWFLVEWMCQAKNEFHCTELIGRFQGACRSMKPDQRDGGVLFGMPLPIMDVCGKQR